MSWVSISPSRKESQSVTSTNLWSKVPKEWGLCCCCLVAQSCLIFATPWIAARQASLSFTISQSLLKLVSIWVGDAIQPSHPLLSPSPPAFSFSQHQGLFQWVGSLHQMAQVLAEPSSSLRWDFQNRVKDRLVHYPLEIGNFSKIFIWNILVYKSYL